MPRLVFGDPGRRVQAQDAAPEFGMVCRQINLHNTSFVHEAPYQRGKRGRAHRGPSFSETPATFGFRTGACPLLLQGDRLSEHGEAMHEKAVGASLRGREAS